MTTKTNQFTVTFHRVEMEHDMAFEQCLENLLEDYKPDYTKKFLGPIHTKYGLQHWHGSIKLAKTDRLPRKINIDTGEQCDLNLAESEGLLYLCAFMYVPKERLLLVSKDVGAPGLELLVSQVKAKYSPKKLEVIPLFRRDLYETLNDATIVSSFCFKIGRLPMDMTGDAKDDIDLLDALDKVKYGVATIKLEGRKENPMDATWVQKTAARLFGKEQVRELVVNIKEEESDRKTIPIHLTEFAMSVKVELPYIGRNVMIEEHERALERAYAQEHGIPVEATA